METKTHWRQLVNLAYIGAYSLDGKDLTVKILSVKQELVTGDKGKEEPCTVAQLEGQKPFIINRTNAKTISKLYNTPYVEDWAGKLITLYPTTTKVAGETVECLRIRAVVPVVVKTDNSAAIKSLRSCTTIEQLKSTYDALTKQQQADTVGVKDEMKSKLTV
jgi:hypothetical protein